MDDIHIGLKALKLALLVVCVGKEVAVEVNLKQLHRSIFTLHINNIVELCHSFL